MCWWCGSPDCEDGEECDFELSTNPLLDSDTFRGAVRRIEFIIGESIAYAPGVPWSGGRPAFIPGVRNAVMRGGDDTEELICPVCHTAIDGTDVHIDHRIPWKIYTDQSAKAAMREHGLVWIGGSLPDDFVRVMSSDPDNLQAAHSLCNERKSDSMPGQPAGVSRRNNKAEQEAEAAYERAEEQRRVEEQRKARAKRAARREAKRQQQQGSGWGEWQGGWDGWRRGSGPDWGDPGGAGILA